MALFPPSRVASTRHVDPGAKDFPRAHGVILAGQRAMPRTGAGGGGDGGKGTMSVGAMGGGTWMDGMSGVAGWGGTGARLWRTKKNAAPATATTLMLTRSSFVGPARGADSSRYRLLAKLRELAAELIEQSPGFGHMRRQLGDTLLSLFAIPPIGELFPRTGEILLEVLHPRSEGVALVSVVP